MGWKLEERWVSNFFWGVSFRPLILYSFLLSVSGRELGPHFPNGLNFRGQKVWSPNCVSPQRCAIHGETPRFFGVAIQGKRNKRELLGKVTTVYPLVSSFFEDQRWVLYTFVYTSKRCHVFQWSHVLFDKKSLFVSGNFASKWSGVLRCQSACIELTRPSMDGNSCSDPHLTHT